MGLRLGMTYGQIMQNNVYCAYRVQYYQVKSLKILANKTGLELKNYFCFSFIPTRINHKNFTIHAIVLFTLKSLESENFPRERKQPMYTFPRERKRPIHMFPRERKCPIYIFPRERKRPIYMFPRERKWSIYIFHVSTRKCPLPLAHISDLQIFRNSRY